MNGWPAKERVLAGGITVSASQTDAPISQEHPVTAGGALNAVFAVTATAVTGTVDLKVQTAIGNSWVDSKATTIAAPGTVYIKLLSAAAADQTYLPLLGKVRVVATTGGGEAITVSSVYVLMEQ